MPRTKDEILKNFDDFMKVPEISERMKYQTCYMCGERYDKSVQVQHVKKLMNEYAEAYAQEKFEKAMVKETTDTKWMNEKFSGCCGEEATGWNDCREAIIKRWNEQ